MTVPEFITATTKCTLQCPFCSIVSSYEYSNWKKLDQIKGRVISICGGDPLTNPGLLYYLITRTNSSPIINLFIPGYTIPQEPQKLTNVNIIVIMPHFEEEDYDRFCGQSGAFKQVLTGIDLLIGKGLKPSLLFVTSKHNVHLLPDVYDFCLERKLLLILGPTPVYVSTTLTSDEMAAIRYYSGKFSVETIDMQVTPQADRCNLIPCHPVNVWQHIRYLYITLKVLYFSDPDNPVNTLQFFKYLVSYVALNI